MVLGFKIQFLMYTGCSIGEKCKCKQQLTAGISRELLAGRLHFIEGLGMKN